MSLWNIFVRLLMNVLIVQVIEMALAYDQTPYHND